MSIPITTEAVVAVHQCKRKAFLLLHEDESRSAHKYDEILMKRAEAVRQKYLDSGERKATSSNCRNNSCSRGSIAQKDLVASCDAVYQQKDGTQNKHTPHEPQIAIGTSSITPEQKIELAFAGYVIGQIHRYRPTHGFIIPFQGNPRRVRIDSLYPLVEMSVEWLRSYRNDNIGEAPPLILNKHCATCPFRQRCLTEAKKEDNLSLLDRMTP